MGIYVHIPFCRSKCFYCGFYSVASARLREEFIKAFCREVDLRKNYLTDALSETLYFGGGTPSYLTIEELGVMVNKLESVYRFESQAERTIEMNPEDVTEEKLKGLRELGFNRLSIGVQSFSDIILKRINRTHSSRQAIEAVELATACGFDNIGIDLIIGLPGYTVENMKTDFEVLNTLKIKHLSVYILSIDSNSVFEKLLRAGKFEPDDDDDLAVRWLMVSDYLKRIGFEHYEISNFAREQKYARHNTSYWQQKEYIGFGPSAHSYNFHSRQWNVSNLKTYIDSLNNSLLNFDKEELSESDKYNEYIMTNLRTMWGADLNFLQQNRGDRPESFNRKIELYVEGGYAVIEGERLRLTERGWLISDGIFSDLFI